MLPVNFDDLTPNHIQELIESEVAEGLTLEYKEQLPGDQSDDKRKFLYGIAALANSAGGDMVFGIVDRDGPDGQNTGIAARLSGITIPNVQKAIEPLAHLIRDGIAPRLTGVMMKVVTCPEGDVVVIRVPASWNRPHMVTIGKADKFYTRTAIGSSPMSVEEIGRAFSEQSELRESIARWRMHRAELIEKGTGPAQLSGEVAMLFHLIPANSLGRDLLREPWRVTEDDKNYMYVPYGAYHPQYNADGFLCLAQFDMSRQGVYGYTQLFRSGIVEYADANVYRVQHGSANSVIWGQEIEKQMVHCYKDAITRFRRNGRTGSVYVGFSLIGILGKSLFGTTMTTIGLSPIRQNVFSSPEVLVDMSEPEEHPFSRTLLPLVDTMWQVGGREGTPFIPRGGKWDPFPQYN